LERTLHVGGQLPGVLTTAGTPRAGVVALHPGGDPSRDFPLIHHLARALPPHGIAVLRFDRRPPRTPDGDVSLSVQTADAIAAIADLRAATSAELPIVLWGFSQGAWTALLAAHELPLAGIAVVGACGVTPADQMRYMTARQMRGEGFGEEAVADLLETRRVWEEALRGGSAAEADRVLRHASRQPWFSLAALPGEFEPTSPDDFEFFFDPAHTIRTLPCPLLAVVGDDDFCVPLAESIAVLETAPEVSFLHVPGGNHGPTTDGQGQGDVLPGYEAGLIEWIGRRVA
jgi:pimeloyl-ACP methyl ester carboxylesterase